MSCSANFSNFTSDCVSKPDYKATAKLVEACGFPLTENEIKMIAAGQCESVIVGFTKDENVPYVELTVRGYNSYVKLHENGAEAENFVKSIIKTHFEKIVAE